MPSLYEWPCHMRVPATEHWVPFKQNRVLTRKAKVNFESILSGIRISQNKYQHHPTLWRAGETEFITRAGSILAAPDREVGRVAGGYDTLVGEEEKLVGLSDDSGCTAVWNAPAFYYMYWLVGTCVPWCACHSLPVGVKGHLEELCLFLPRCGPLWSNSGDQT